MKWFIFWDSLMQKRSDGALVRLVYLMPPGSDEVDADRVLAAFIAEAAVLLDDYIPR